MRLENPKKHWKEGKKENIWTTYYGSQTIFIETGETNHDAFFEQCLEFDIVFIDTSDVAKNIELHKGGNIKPKVMKEL
jgi:hypothetical protein